MFTHLLFWPRESDFSLNCLSSCFTCQRLTYAPLFVRPWTLPEGIHKFLQQGVTPVTPHTCKWEMDIMPQQSALNSKTCTPDQARQELLSQENEQRHEWADAQPIWRMLRRFSFPGILTLFPCFAPWFYFLNCVQFRKVGFFFLGLLKSIPDGILTATAHSTAFFRGLTKKHAELYFTWGYVVKSEISTQDREQHTCCTVLLAEVVHKLLELIQLMVSHFNRIWTERVQVNLIRGNVRTESLYFCPAGNLRCASSFDRVSFVVSFPALFVVSIWHLKCWCTHG